MKNTKITELDTFSHKMYVQLDVFGAFVVDWVCRHVHRRYIVTVRDRSFVNVAVKLTK
jgi:hypothetical protein